MQIQSLVQSPYAPMKVHRAARMHKDDNEAKQTNIWEKGASAVFSHGADDQRAKVKAMNEKLSSIQAMLQTLKSIEGKVETLQNFANDMSGTELTSEGSSQLFSYFTSVRSQIRAFVGMMKQEHLRERTEQGDLVGLAEGFKAEDVMSVDPADKDLTTPEGIEKYLKSMRERVEGLASYEGYIKDQQRLLVEEQKQLEYDLVSVMRTDGHLNDALAMNMASLVGEKLLSGLDIVVDMGTREASRAANLLRHFS